MQLLESAIALAADQRACFLKAQCADQHDLRMAVETLLASDRTTIRLAGAHPHGQDQPAMRAARSTSRPIHQFPATVGHYVVHAEIGAGGMGVVYRAQQSQPHRWVALKLLRDVEPTAAGLVQFTREIQALGLMRHPGIAHLYEAGTVTIDGVDFPFLAMELVEGLPLLAWVQQANPTIATRVRLMSDVSDAVHAAHQCGVIHRDLKPENILVEAGDARPRPRILDFGIARLPTDQPVSGPGAVAGTVAHMSPEQAAGAVAIDVRSDVYALGSITYQVLTGSPPLPTTGLAFDDALRLIREQVPAPLSQHDRLLRGDLEFVVAAALAKSPADRPASAREFGLDLDRVLAHRAVSGRRPTSFYLLSRFVRRHRLLCASLTLSFAALLTALVAVWAAFTQAAADRGRLVATFRFTVEKVVGQLGNLAGTSEVRANALREFLPSMEDCVRLFPANREARRCVNAILCQLGDIETEVENFPAALLLRQQALASQEGLLADDPQAPGHLADWAVAIIKLGDAEKLSGQSALPRYQQAHHILTELAAAYPDTARHVDDLAWSCSRLAHLAIDSHQLENAVTLLQQQATLLQRLQILQPGSPFNLAGERALHCLWAHLEGMHGNPAEQQLHLLRSITPARQRLLLQPNAPLALIEFAGSVASYVQSAHASLDPAERERLLDEAQVAVTTLLAQEREHGTAKSIAKNLEGLRRLGR